MERYIDSFSRTPSTIPSRFMISMFLSAIAHMTGCPPKVIPCMNIDSAAWNGSMTRSVVRTAPIDAYAEERPFAQVTRSGLMSYSSDANQCPIRPKPVITSSAQSRIPYRSQISRTPWK